MFLSKSWSLNDILLFRTFHSTLSYKWGSNLWHQKSETPYWHSKVDVNGNPRWLICITKRSCCCFETKWVNSSPLFVIFFIIHFVGIWKYNFVLIICPQNRAAFEKEIEGLPSTRSVGELPPELHCPLCKEVMKDAVLTSKCCFKSFCYKCKLFFLSSFLFFIFLLL